MQGKTQSRTKGFAISIRFGWILLLSAAISPSVEVYATGGQATARYKSIAVAAQYDTTHVYVSPADMDKLVASFVATFGGTPSKVSVQNVLPVPSTSTFQAVFSPVGNLSVFAYQTPIPFPFGEERTGYLVTDMDEAIKAARAAGAEVIVEPFRDAIGLDAVIQWPGGVKMQLYWHLTPPKYPSLATIPENRIYISRDEADSFVKSFLKFSQGKMSSDDKHADSGEIGRPGETYRRIRLSSLFGSAQVLVTDGHLPYPFGRETTGYQVEDVAATLQKAAEGGATILAVPYKTNDRTTAIVTFPGGYIAEIHSVESH